MAVGITAVLIFTFYLLAVPVQLAVKLRASHGINFGAGLAIFEGKYALHQAEKRLNGEKKHLPWKKFGLDAEKIRSFRALKYLIRHLKIENLTLTGTVGTDDAAATAMICGCAEALRCGLEAAGYSRRITLALQPDFSGNGSRISFSGMVRARAGHIICAALIGAVYLAKGKILQWKNIRLKTS